MIAMSKDAYAGLSVFSGLTTEQLNSLDTLLVQCRFPQGFTIFEQGQPATNLFIVREGEIVISYKPYDGPSLTVARIQPGGVFGWSSALRRDIYTSSAHAVCDSSAFCISGTSLQRFCEQHPATGAVFLDHLAGVIAARLNNTHTEILSILTRGMDLSDNSKRRTESL